MNNKKVIIENKEFNLVYQDTTLIEEILKLNKVEFMSYSTLSQSVEIYLKNTLKQCCIHFYCNDDNKCNSIAINICIDVNEHFSSIDEMILADFQNVLTTSLFLSNRNISRI